jgi:hypothetical protein
MLAPTHVIPIAPRGTDFCDTCGRSPMATVRFAVNQLQYRDPALAARFEDEISEAVASLDGTAMLECRILVVEGDPGRVRIQFEKPGWVKGFPPVSVQAPPGQVKNVAEGVLRSSLPPA